mmetsp:Transcript_6154/g.8899  ORF Transcript_6154/g.8899 Transcript_6154/m.8899 type:complete len:160 (-) Transcript_6154:953-1432(-)
MDAAIVSTLKSIYDLIWGQCSETLCSRLQGTEDFKEYSANASTIALLKATMAQMTGFKDKQYIHHSIHCIMREFYSLSQGKHRSNQQYYDEFSTLWSAAKDCGVGIGNHPGGTQETLQEIAVDPRNPTDEERELAKKSPRNNTLPLPFCLDAIGPDTAA